MRAIIGATTFTVLLAIAPPGMAAAQQDSTAKTAPPAGAYSAEQATRGADGYRAQCSSCHQAKDHFSADFQQSWNGRTVKALYDYIRSTMPDDAPGVLTEQQYLDVTAYILKLNGMPAGSAPLTSDTLVQKKLIIDIKPRTPAPLR